MRKPKPIEVQTDAFATVVELCPDYLTLKTALRLQAWLESFIAWKKEGEK